MKLQGTILKFVHVFRSSPLITDVCTDLTVVKEEHLRVQLLTWRSALSDITKGLFAEVHIY